MRWVGLLLLAYLSLIVWTAVHKLIPWFAMAPDPIILYAMYFGFTAKKRIPMSTFHAIVIGYLGDLLYGILPGTWAFICGCVCLLVAWLSSVLVFRRWMYVLIFTFVLALAAGLLFIGLRAYFQQGLGSFGREFSILLGMAFFSALFSPVVFRLCQALDRFVSRGASPQDGIFDSGGR